MAEEEFTDTLQCVRMGKAGPACERLTGLEWEADKAVPNFFPCSHPEQTSQWAWFMGIISPATDLAPVCIWEECDLTICLFQTHPCLTSTSLFLKPSSVKDCRVRTRERSRKADMGMDLQAYSSFLIFFASYIPVSFLVKLYRVERAGRCAETNFKQKKNHVFCENAGLMLSAVWLCWYLLKLKMSWTKKKTDKNMMQSWTKRKLKGQKDKQTKREV